MRLKYVPEIEGSPVVQYVGNAWCQLMQAGLWDRTSVLISGGLSCVYATENKKIVGCLTWHGDSENWTINLGYVSPEYRRKGVYTKLHDDLIVRAKAAGVKQVTSIVKPGNAPIIDSKDKAGYTLHSLYYILDLKS
jgi:GNAT superfamily N-acetyltransferase